jgi:hypothetical protein
MYSVDSLVTVSDSPPNNGNGYVQVNPNPQPSTNGTYAILVTGWSKPSRFDWDIVPNLLAKGTLYNAEAGVKLLLNSITSNPLVDRVYLLALTRYDLVSQSFKAAYDAIKGSGLAVSVTFDLPVEPLAVPTGFTKAALQYPPSNNAGGNSDVYVRYQQSLMHKVLTQGKHYADRKFTALTNQVVTLTNPPLPDWQEYFTQWVLADPPSDPGVSYTYGQKIMPQLHKITEGVEFSTQRVVTLLDQCTSGGEPAGIPCLTQLNYFDNELTAIFRSHDIGRAWLMNTQALAYCFYQWFPTLDNRKLTIVSINAHVYDWDRPSTGGFVCDPQGYFYFKVTKDGKYECYLNDTLVYTCGTKALLQRYISKNHPDLSTGHAFWLANAILTL